MSRIRELLEIAEAKGGVVRPSDIPGKVQNNYALLSNAKKKGYLFSVRAGEYRLTTEGRELLVDRHMSQLARRPADWLTVGEEIDRINEETETLKKYEISRENPVLNSLDWQAKYFEQVEFMQELLRNLTKGEKQ